MAMSTPTGLFSPPPPSRTATSSIVVSPGKRKREESNRPTSNKETLEGEKRAKFEVFMRDLLEILKRQDTKPSILNHPLSKDPAEPTAKRQKVLEHSTNATITSKLNLGAYMSWSELVADVEAASSAILAVFQSKSSLPNGTFLHRHYPPLPDDENLTASILAFKKTFNNIIARERMQRPSTSDLDVKSEDAADLDGTVVVNGFGGSKPTSFVGGDSRPNGVVLTLYGNAPQPKQLFSSLQEPIRISPTALSDRSGRNLDFNSSTISPTVQVVTPLREAALPNGISTTQIVPVHSTTTAPEGKKVPTLGDIFPPPATLPQLNPPKQSKHTTTRGSTVGWFNPSEPSLSSRSNRLGTYTTQPLSTGQWLTYNAIPPPQSSSEIRRSKRDRSSSDAAKAQLNLEALARHSRAKEDALFRSAYSSFAPSYDDSSAIVSQEVKSRLWWERVRGKRFEQLLAEPFLEAADDLIAPIYGEAGAENQDEELFREAVESWVPEDPPTDFKMDEAHKESQDMGDKDLDEILKDISELLETLNSHQRIRNLSLAPMSQTAVGQNRQITAMTGSPSSPSSAEMDIYNILKSQLSILIASLPPYAVAKLDGEQLSELNVSTKMVVEGKDYKGVMEEDETAPRASALAALSAAAGSAARITGPPVSQYPVQSQYNATRTPTTQYHQRSASNAQLSSSRSQQGTQQYYQQQQTPVRPPSSNTQRDPIATPHTSFQHPQRSSSTNSHRVSTGTTAQQSYAPQTPRPAQSQYGQSNSQQYFQQQGTPHGYQQYHSHSQSSAQSPATSRQFPQQSQTQYQQQAALRQHFAPAQSQYVGARSSSPLKAQQPQQQQRGINPMSGQTPARQSQYFQQSSQSQYQTPSTLGASGFHTYMSAEQQALLMERQRATLAQQNQQNQQQQARAAAQVNTQRHAVNATLPPTNQPQALQQSQQEYGSSGTQGFTGVQMTNSLNQQHTANSGSTVTAGNGR